MDQNLYNGKLSSYVIGFVASLALSCIPFLLVEMRIQSHDTAFTQPFLITVIVLCAVAQLICQLVFFVHVWHGASGRSNLLALALGLIFTCILVGGSLWIMYNLNYRMMPQTTAQMEQYMNDQDSM